MPRWPNQQKRKRVIPPHCMFVLAHGCCTERAGHGKFGHFCEEHAELLGRFREEMATSMTETKRWGGSGGGRSPRCCTVGCFNERVPPAAFCDSCQDAGCVEEVA